MVSKGFLKTYRFLCYEILFLIAFGGSVRAMNAGLACPDWPLCFGDYVPDFHIQVYFEFIHRLLAGTVGLWVLGFGVYLLMNKNVSSLVKRLSIFSIILVAIQVVVGGLTVLLLLKESVVTLHLFLATLLFACVLVTYWELRELHKPTQWVGVPKVLSFYSQLVVGAIWVQLLLGGLVASHYAGLACPDFPLCHGKLIPTLSGQIGLHVLHRLGAYTCVLLIAGFWIATRQMLPAENHLINKWNNRLFLGIWIQVILGIANIFFATPPLMVVLHLLMGTILLGISVRLAYLLSRSEASIENELLVSLF